MRGLPSPTRGLLLSYLQGAIHGQGHGGGADGEDYQGHCQPQLVETADSFILILTKLK